mmetsp:Transcript_2967/g.4451  ORF Transcript_2967/g.4451 Transcript_2967/m.4451 type:complete len:206 (-) Transcript_2967:81-698(-)
MNTFLEGIKNCPVSSICSINDGESNVSPLSNPVSRPPPRSRTYSSVTSSGRRSPTNQTTVSDQSALSDMSARIDALLQTQKEETVKYEKYTKQQDKMDQTVASLQDQIIGMLENNKTNDRLLRKCQQHQQRQLNQFAHAFDLLFKKFDIDASSLPVVDDMPSEFNSSSSSVKPSKAAYYKPSMVNMLVEFVKFTKTPMGAGTHKS